MKPFTYARPDDAAGAVDLVAGDPDAAFLAGGTNLVDHLKLGIASPTTLVDVTSLTSDRIDDLPPAHGDTDGGLRIGAAVRNSDLAAHGRVRAEYPVLAEALLQGASGQLRNMATTGGNLLQRTRCAYFGDRTTPCNKREPGSGCSAIGGWARYHAILGATHEPAGQACVATHPSDMAVAMAVLDAQVQVLGPDGERTIPLEEFHRLPGDDPTRDTVLRHGELITAVDLPAAPIATSSTYRKVRDRASYAFALVSVAAAMEVVDGPDGPVVADVRIALGGVAHTPWRATRAEDALRGGPATDEAFRAAAAAETAGARPIESAVGGNAFKVPLVAGTLAAALRTLAHDPSTDPTEEPG
ncbi:xanthine dehydrogenase family protein subunit M [Actinomycetospora sp. TBRC 11914]|uniref:FAD binding domain-containing protein n=1 Tax=Actinomycetospora sp. TBRC 11914 TaxID=2729387 RepID=UPI00145F3349|nr:xanthine dehydrogenase family protein subunit M [Actinomycetospora sp. TBRC 11914]NMO88337.1 xanthine dehydrogenase family protein subunit M [Actinomycetospora sp. TBRC 11914]